MDDGPNFTKEEAKSTSHKSKRITPRDLTNKSSMSKAKTPTNAMKQTKVQKFNAGLKMDLIKKAKETAEAEKREVEAQRQMDAQKLKATNKKAAKNVIYASIRFGQETQHRQRS